MRIYVHGALSVWGRCGYWEDDTELSSALRPTQVLRYTYEVLRKQWFEGRAFNATTYETFFVQSIFVASLLCGGHCDPFPHFPGLSACVGNYTGLQSAGRVLAGGQTQRRREVKSPLTGTAVPPRQPVLPKLLSSSAAGAPLPPSRPRALGVTIPLLLPPGFGISLWRPHTPTSPPKRAVVNIPPELTLMSSAAVGRLMQALREDLGDKVINTKAVTFGPAGVVTVTAIITDHYEWPPLTAHLPQAKLCSNWTLKLVPL